MRRRASYDAACILQPNQLQHNMQCAGCNPHKANVWSTAWATRAGARPATQLACSCPTNCNTACSVQAATHTRRTFGALPGQRAQARVLQRSLHAPAQSIACSQSPILNYPTPPHQVTFRAPVNGSPAMPPTGAPPTTPILNYPTPPHPVSFTHL